MRPTSARDFVRSASFGAAVDYDALDSPRYAIDHSVVIVEGTLEAVTTAPAYSHGDPVTDARSVGDYMVLVIRVVRVLSGSDGVVQNDLVYARHLVGGTSIADLTRILPEARVVAVASGLVTDRATTWPDAVPSDAQLVDVYVDGLWLQGKDDPAMLGIYTDPAALPPTWNAPTTIDAVLELLSAAANG